MVEATCSVETCTRPTRHVGLCNAHSQRLRSGKPMLDPMRSTGRGRSLEERFWSRVDRRGPDECWLWLGFVQQNGYGKFTTGPLGRSRCWLAHRLAWFVVHGVEPDQELDHLCRTKRCVNPNHLEPVPHKENQLRAVPYRQPRARALSSHCRHGHEYTVKNTYLPPVGTPRESFWRQCRRCRAAAVRRRHGLPTEPEPAGPLQTQTGP